MSASFENLLYDLDAASGILTLTLNRPSKLNALNAATIEDIDAAVQRALDEPTVRGIILTGSGEKAFVAGADIAELAALTPAQAARAAERGQETFCRIEESTKPVVAAVNGFALGGGCELAMMCDFIIAADNAKFGQPEIKLGLIPGSGGTQRLPRAVGKSKAMDMALTGRMMDAMEAERAGLVSRVVPLDQLMNEVLGAALVICDYGQLAVMAAKESINRAFESSLSEGMLFERRLFHAMFSTADKSEGMDAFLNKRKAVFTHR